MPPVAVDLDAQPHLRVGEIDATEPTEAITDPELPDPRRSAAASEVLDTSNL